MAEDTGGLLGSKEMQDLLAQFQPSEDDRKMARAAALWSMGAGILGTPGGLGHAIGIGAQAAIPAYYSTLQQEQQRRMQNAQTTALLYPLMIRDQFMRAGQQYLSGGQPPASVQGQLPPTAAPVVPSAGMAPSTAAQFGPAPPPPANLAASNVQPAPMEVPRGTPPQSIAGFPQIDPRTQNPAAIGMAFMSGDPKVVTDTLTKLGATNSVRAGDGSLITAYNGLPIAHVTPAGVQMFDPRTGRPTQFLAYAGDKATAEAQYTATIEGAKTAAVEGAKLPYQEAMERYKAGFQTVQVPVSGGGTQPIPLLSFLGNQAPGGAPAGQQAASAPPTALPGPVPGTTVSPNVRPDQMDAIRRDAAATGVGAVAPAKSYKGQIPIVARPPSVVGVPQSTEQATVSAGLGKQTLDDLAHYNDMGERAADIKGRLQLMEGLAEQVNAGVYEPAISEFGRILTRFGASPDQIQAITGSSPSAADAYNKLAIQTASEGLRQSLQGAGRYTQMEWQKFLEAYPNLTMTPQGRRIASQIMIGTTNYALAKQEAAQDYFNTNRSLNGFGTWFNKTNSAESFLPSIDQAKALMGAPTKAAAGGATGQPSPLSIAHLRQHPELRGVFDQTYGTGAAARVLGQ